MIPNKVLIAYHWAVMMRSRWSDLRYNCHCSQWHHHIVIASPQQNKRHYLTLMALLTPLSIACWTLGRPVFRNVGIFCPMLSTGCQERSMNSDHMALSSFTRRCVPTLIPQRAGDASKVGAVNNTSLWKVRFPDPVWLTECEKMSIGISFQTLWTCRWNSFHLFPEINLKSKQKKPQYRVWCPSEILSWYEVLLDKWATEFCSNFQMVLCCGSALKSGFVAMAPRDRVIESVISISNLLYLQAKTKKKKK